LWWFDETSFAFSSFDRQGKSLTPIVPFTVQAGNRFAFSADLRKNGASRQMRAMPVTFPTTIPDDAHSTNGKLFQKNSWVLTCVPGMNNRRKSMKKDACTKICVKATNIFAPGKTKKTR